MARLMRRCVHCTLRLVSVVTLACRTALLFNVAVGNHVRHQVCELCTVAALLIVA